MYRGKNMTTASVLKSIIPVSRFNKGEAGRIFDELTLDTTKIVVKNNVPVAVILSPEEYTRLIEMNEDNILLAEAAMRIGHADKKDFITEADFISSIGLTEADIANIDDVEIE